MKGAVVGAMEISFALHGCANLKDRRHIVQSFIEHCRSKYKVSAMVCEPRDSLEKAVVVISLVGATKEGIKSILRESVVFLEDKYPIHVIEITEDWL